MILLVVIVTLLVSFGSSLRAYLNQQEQINHLKAQIAQSNAAVTSIEEQQKRWGDPAYVQQQARLRFGWVMPGQTPYVVIGENGQPLNTKSVLDAPAPTAQKQKDAWWTRVTASLETADNPPITDTKQAPIKRIG